MLVFVCLYARVPRSARVCLPVNIVNVYVLCIACSYMRLCYYINKEKENKKKFFKRQKGREMKTVYKIFVYSVRAYICDGAYREEEDECESGFILFDTLEQAREAMREQVENDIHCHSYHERERDITFYRYSIEQATLNDEDGDMTYGETIDVFDGIPNDILWNLMKKDPSGRSSLATLDNLEAAKTAEEFLIIIDAYGYEGCEEGLYVPRFKCTVPTDNGDITECLKELGAAPEVPEILKDENGEYKKASLHLFESWKDEEEAKDAEAAYLEDLQEAYQYYEEEVDAHILFEHRDNIIAAAKEKQKRIYDKSVENYQKLTQNNK